MAITQAVGSLDLTAKAVLGRVSKKSVIGSSNAALKRP